MVGRAGTLDEQGIRISATCPPHRLTTLRVSLRHTLHRVSRKAYQRRREGAAYSVNCNTTVGEDRRKMAEVFSAGPRETFPERTSGRF